MYIPSPLLHQNCVSFPSNGEHVPDFMLPRLRWLWNFWILAPRENAFDRRQLPRWTRMENEIRKSWRDAFNMDLFVRNECSVAVNRFSRIRGIGCAFLARWTPYIFCVCISRAIIVDVMNVGDVHEYCRWCASRSITFHVCFCITSITKSREEN